MEIILTGLFKGNSLEPLICLIDPHIYHTELSRHNSIRLVWKWCDLCLWLHLPLCPTSCCTVGLSDSVFISIGWSLPCGDEILLLQTLDPSKAYPFTARQLYHASRAPTVNAKVEGEAIAVTSKWKKKKKNCTACGPIKTVSKIMGTNCLLTLY